MSKKQTTKVTGVAPMPIIPEMVSVKDMVPCPWNKRSDKEKGVKDLADSIAAQGLLNPAIVRVHPSQRGKYEILAGERRWRACSTIWTHMPVVNKGDISDEHARQITTIENLQREDLTPIEQAEDIHELQALGLDNRAIASKLGKSVTWVAKRARLADLSPKWKKLIGKENGPFSKWAPAHFELIARYDAETQDELLSQHWWGVTTVADLEKHLGNMNKKLSTAPWKLSDETLIPKAGACSACQKRASCQPELFAGTDDAIEAMSVPKNDRCLPPDRYCPGQGEAQHRFAAGQRRSRRRRLIRPVSPEKINHP
jgi:ParB/RepB/Spo0J family partition protein